MYYSTYQFEVAIFQGLNSHTWPVATVSDIPDVEHFFPLDTDARE